MPSRIHCRRRRTDHSSETSPYELVTLELSNSLTSLLTPVVLL